MYEDIDIPVPPTFDDDYATGRTQPGTRRCGSGSRLPRRPTSRRLSRTGLTPAEEKHWKYQRYIKDYLRCVASIDDNVGRLLDYLDAEGLTEDTIVVYTSDQGFFLGDHGWYDKRFMYEESLRMPLLIRYPREIPAGSTSTRW